MPRARQDADHSPLPLQPENPRAGMLDTLPSEEVIKLLVDEEATAVKAVRACATELATAARLVAEKLTGGGRLVYVGVGSAGRMGALEATECTPAFGLAPSLIVSIIGGGPQALVRAVDAAYDNSREADQRMRRAAVGPADVVCGVADGAISSFLRTALEYGRFRKAVIVLITCDSPDPEQDRGLCDVFVNLACGPELIAGQTRLKAATALKLALQGLSTAAFVQIGKTYGGLMVDVRPNSTRSWRQAIGTVCRLTHLDPGEAEKLIKKAGGRAKVALVMHHARVNAARAKELLIQHKGSLRAIIGDVDLY